MRTLFGLHPWKLTEDTLHLSDMRLSESLTSLGNAAMGMRGNFEECFSGDHHRGFYLSGVWFPDKTRVGWWKNGYPDYFGKVLNAPDVLSVGVCMDGVPIDLATDDVVTFYRELDMEHGILTRRVTIRKPQGLVRYEVERFLSIARKELLAIRMRVTPDFPSEITFAPSMDMHVTNEDSNYQEAFWEPVDAHIADETATLLAQTKPNPFGTPRFLMGAVMGADGEATVTAGRVAFKVTQRVQQNETAEYVKLVCVGTTHDLTQNSSLENTLQAQCIACQTAGFDALKAEQATAWRARWDGMDVEIPGDAAAQQGIRYNLFQMLSTYDGTDPTLNIGPKGFTGEKYGGATYWDTEMFCLPMIMCVLPIEAAKSLIEYRKIQLPQAIANAKKLGCEGALYPMVTFTGEECHNEWEITFEEIHRNAAIAYAHWLYYQTTGDHDTLTRTSLPVMIEICRYYTSRMTYNARKRVYMMLGVTGPNEYENNVNNNWYTNRMAQFCLVETAKLMREMGVATPETARFERIAKRVYLPHDKKMDLYLQQDGFLDKALVPAVTLPPEDRPLNQNWSWDRILRSCYIKQADVLQGFYCLRHLYDDQTIERHFDFYEPFTVHESSLSPCVHAILAAQIGHMDKAEEMYHRTARLDLDNVNNDTADGLHITSMAGSWMALVKGFAGMRTEEGFLAFAPTPPPSFSAFAFRVRYQGRTVHVAIANGNITLTLLSGAPLTAMVMGIPCALCLDTPVTRTIQTKEG